MPIGTARQVAEIVRFWPVRPPHAPDRHSVPSSSHQNYGYVSSCHSERSEKSMRTDTAWRSFPWILRRGQNDNLKSRTSLDSTRKYRPPGSRNRKILARAPTARSRPPLSFEPDWFASKLWIRYPVILSAAKNPRMRTPHGVRSRGFFAALRMTIPCTQIPGRNDRVIPHRNSAPHPSLPHRHQHKIIHPQHLIIGPSGAIMDPHFRVPRR
jgi:hypothetical protein